MPIFRLVYIDDDTFAPRTLTAAFADRAAAEIAMARHGHRVVHVAELGAGECAADPVRIAMAVSAGSPKSPMPPAAPTAPLPARGAWRDGLGGAAAVLGIVVVGVAFLIL